MKTLSISAVFSAIFLISCQKTAAPDPDQKPFVKKDSAELVEYGKYLVTVMGCNDCHTPKKLGTKGPELIQELMLSGYPSAQAVPVFNQEQAKKGFAQMSPDMTAAAGPWGISFAANLTPDETGIGNWTYENFKKALTQGKFKGQDNGRMLLPPMPWFNYTEMKEEDLQAIFAYLKSLKPVENRVPAPVSPSQ